MQVSPIIVHVLLHIIPHSIFTYIHSPIYPQWWILLHIHHLYSLLIFTIDSPWLRIRSVDSVHELTCREPYYTCVGLLVDVHVTLWRMSMEPGVAVDAGYWVLFWSWLQSWMVAVNMETYKYNSTFSLSEYWRIFTSYTNLGFASVCILVNIRQYSVRLQVLLYTYRLEIVSASLADRWVGTLPAHPHGTPVTAKLHWHGNSSGWTKALYTYFQPYTLQGNPQMFPWGLLEKMLLPASFWRCFRCVYPTLWA